MPSIELIPDSLFCSLFLQLSEPQSCSDADDDVIPAVSDGLVMLFTSYLAFIFVAFLLMDLAIDGC